jgi:hypothetical protein
MQYWLFFVLLLSRVLFLASYPHFFDSPEYVSLAQLNNFSLSLQTSHDPVHPVYLWLIQFAQKPWHLSLISAVFGVFGIFIFYSLAKLLFNKKTALSVLPFLIFFPHLWLIQTNILHESVEHFFFLAALYFYALHLKQNRLYFLILSAVCLYLSLLNFVGILAYVPIFFGLVFFLTPKTNIIRQSYKTIIFIALCFFLAIFSYHLLKASYSLANTFFQNLTITDFVRTLRNAIYILSFGYTPLGLLAITISFWRLLQKKQQQYFFFYLAFVFSFLLTAKFWYGGLYGRYSSLFAYGLALLLATQLRRIEYWLTLFSVFVIFSATGILYQQTPIAKIQAELIAQLPKKKKQILVISDYQRPQLEYEKALTFKTLVITDSDYLNKQVIIKLKQAKKNNYSVYFTKQALTFPYYQYDGQALHILSKSSSRKTKLYNFLQKRKLVVIKKTPNNKYLDIYKLK